LSKGFRGEVQYSPYPFRHSRPAHL
jgi:hypothetical protein